MSGFISKLKLLKKPSPILAFYAGNAPNYDEKRFEDILLWDDERLECNASYLQWLFPLPIAICPDYSAPLLTTDDILAFDRTPECRDNLHRSFQRMLAFYGFDEVKKSPPIIIRSANWESRSKVWLTADNYNFARITQILASMSVLGLENHANAFLEELSKIYMIDEGNCIARQVYHRWHQATVTPGGDSAMADPESAYHEDHPPAQYKLFERVYLLEPQPTDGKSKGMIIEQRYFSRQWRYTVKIYESTHADYKYGDIYHGAVEQRLCQASTAL